LQTPWDEIFSAHLRCLWAIGSNNDEEACACQLVLVKYPLSEPDLFVLTSVLWLGFSLIWNHSVDQIVVAAVDLRRFAHALDALSNKKVDDADSAYGSHLERVAQAIMKLFQICAADSLTAIEDSKKRGMMGLANQLFKIYFQINKLNLCKPIIRAIENVNIDAHFSIAQRVTYNYYVGRKAMFDGDLKMANTCLTFAFERCLASNKANKRLILIYLIPVRMLLGILPYNALLQKYKLEEFEGISNAVKIGNLRKLNEELERNEAFFISCGIYLILEKLKMITYRNLFKRIAGILKTHLLPVPAFTETLKKMGVEDIDADETECILANLVFEGKIKGYLAHQQQKLVVSKIQPFPSL
uniref:CSN12-like protein n=1 Tax=Hydatigena taeniaeformis TaxID=6205 RepID=A0A0R3WQV8_HYDTA